MGVPEVDGHPKPADPVGRLRYAARDLFEDLDSYAALCNEVSCISKRAGRLEGRATDIVSAYLAGPGLLQPGCFGRTDTQVLCFGSDGAAVAISVSFAEALNPPDWLAQFTRWTSGKND